MAGEWAIVVAGVGSAAVAGASAWAPVWFARKEAREQRLADAEAAREVARIQRFDEQVERCARVGRAAGAYTAATHRTNTLSPTTMTELHTALAEVAILGVGETAAVAESWYHDVTLQVKETGDWAAEFVAAFRAQYKAR